MMKIEQLMRPEIKDEWGIKDLQNCILNIAKYIHDFCEENNIQYCIMGGTALGAVRHGGFIPWDDDIDLFMTASEYAKFRKCFKEKGDHERFYLQEKGSAGEITYSAKLRMNGTTFIEDMTKDWDIHQGIFVDIMILRNYPKNFFSQKWFILWENYLYLKSAANLNYQRRGKLVSILLTPIKILPKRFLWEYALNQSRKYKNEECDCFFHYYISMKKI